MQTIDKQKITIDSKELAAIDAFISKLPIPMYFSGNLLIQFVPTLSLFKYLCIYIYFDPSLHHIFSIYDYDSYAPKWQPVD